ncbi:hypothetical protein RQN30_07430 [Arcanobacterium hippocoleae]
MSLNQPDVQSIISALDALIEKPIYSIQPSALKQYETEYFEKDAENRKK